MEFRLRHPTLEHVYALYGYDADPYRGYWAEVKEEPHVITSYAVVIQDYVVFDVRGAVLDRYGALTPNYDTVRPVVGLLRFLAGRGFFDLTDVEDAIGIIETKGLEGLPTRFAAIVEVIRNLEEAD